ncbi:MAG: NAD(P)H-binding protein [Myxococcales bacterium]
MEVAVVGATGPTGRKVCQLALAAGHTVRATRRHDSSLPLPASDALRVVHADAVTGTGMREAIAGADAVLSVLGAPSYTPRQITVYSKGTRTIIDALREVGNGNRLVVISSGLTYPPPLGHGLVADRIIFPLLRNVIGRTLYSDMRRMEELVRTCDDIAWTIMRPGRLFDAATVSQYRVDLDTPTQGYTSRTDLAAAMVAELGTDRHVHQAISPTTR